MRVKPSLKNEGQGATPALPSPTGKARPALYYVYGCAAPTGPLPRPATALEAGARCEWIEDRGVAALVSPVPAADYEEAPLARHMAKLPWLTQRVERHNRVLLEAMAHTPVAPCRFGVLLRRREGIVEMLRRLRTPLLSTLARLGESDEWSVKAFAALGAPGVRARGLLPAGLRARRSSRRVAPPALSGRDYLLGRARERAARREAAARARGRTGRIRTAIGRVSADVVPLPVRAAEAKDQLLLNLACLVRRKDTRRWLLQLQSIAEREERHSVRLAWSGPWPPYSFVSALETAP